MASIVLVSRGKRREGLVKRAGYQGTVRDSGTEAVRDGRMLALHEQGLTNVLIAQRMGVSLTSVRIRIERARAMRDAPDAPSTRQSANEA